SGLFCRTRRVGLAIWVSYWVGNVGPSDLVLAQALAEHDEQRRGTQVAWLREVEAGPQSNDFVTRFRQRSAERNQAVDDVVGGWRRAQLLPRGQRGHGGFERTNMAGRARPTTPPRRPPRRPP